MFKTYILKNC